MRVGPLPLASLGAAFEKHVERGEEKEYPARDAEGRHGNTDELQQGLAEEAEQGQQNRRNDAGPLRQCAAVGSVHPDRQGNEQRHQPRRVDDDEQGGKGGDQKGAVLHRDSLTGASRFG